MTTADFAKYKAIVLADPDCEYDPSGLQFAVDTKDVWSPAVTGNIVLIGTDPTFHSSSEPGAVTLIDNSIKFAASGAGGTGLYFALSCYYANVDSANVDALAGFGTFTVRGNLNCYNDVHIVASSPAIATLSDADLSDWSSVHEAFSSYPTSGTGGFQSLAIAKDIMGVGSQSYGDGTSGLPYIISRGAIPAGCGNGKYEPAFAEECDDGSKNGTPGDLCSSSCKCLYGVADASAGTCKSAPPSASGTGTGGGGRTNSTTSVPYPITTSSTTTTSSASSSPTCDNTIVGIEIIVVTDIVEVCPEGSTVTETVTSTLSTLQRPIYPCSTSGHPCYVCEFGSPSTTDFMTVTTVSISHPWFRSSHLPLAVLQRANIC
jgi:cysteine-rich repeat protein